MTKFWNTLGLFQSFLAGIAAAIVTTLAPTYLFGNEASIIGFVCLFPFFIRLTLRAFFKGPYFHQFLATKLGLFCMGWLYSFLFLAWAFFGWT